MSRAAVVYNPVKIRDLAAFTERVEKVMAGRGWEAPLWLATTAEDPGVAVTRQALREGCDLVFASGGDGTVMAAVTALASSGVPLAVLPTGTGNLLARNLDLPVDDELTCLRIGLVGSTRRLDAAAIEGRRFVVMAGMGFDAAMMRDAPEGLKRVLGWPAYVVSGVKHLRRRRIDVTIAIDEGESLTRRARTVIVGNVGQLQGSIPLLPDADPGDGLLDVVVVAGRHPGDLVRIVGRILRRTDAPDRRLERFTGRHIHIEATQAQPRQLDGDVIESDTSLDIRIEPGALLVCVPDPEER